MEPSRRPPNRIDEHGTRQVAPTWESLVDRQIREAIEDGRFDDLPYQGRPLPLVDDSAAGEWALAYRVLKSAGIAPPWIEADKEVRVLLERRDVILAGAETASPAGVRRLRGEMERTVIDLNAAIARLNAEAPTDGQHRRPLVPADELARLDAAGRR